LEQELRLGEMTGKYSRVKAKITYYGANVNRLNKNTHRDRIAATPLHRYVPCRVEPL
jgi:hypothetical protein